MAVRRKRFIYARVAISFPRSPAAVAVGPAAVGWYVAGLTYCAEHKTDGFIPEAAAAALMPCAYEEALELVRLMLRATPGKKHGLWERADGGYVVHDYLEHNLSSDEISARRAAGQAGAAARWSDDGCDSHTNRNATRNANRNAKPNGNTDTDTETSSKGVSGGAADPIARGALWKKARTVLRKLDVNDATAIRIGGSRASDEHLYALACDARDNSRVKRPGGWVVRKLQNDGWL